MMKIPKNAVRSDWRRYVAALIRAGKPVLVCTLLLGTGSPALGQSTAATFADLSSSAASAREAGDIPRAIQLYQQAVRLNPAWAQGWWYVGVLQYSVNAWAPAADALSRYIDLTAKAGPALALRGLCEFEEGLFPESLKDLQQAVALGAANDPRNAGIIHFHEAQLLTRLGRYEEALGEYTILVRHGVTSDEVISGLGLAGLRMPLLAKDADPSSEPLIEQTGRAAASIIGGDIDAGSRDFDELFIRFPTTPNLHYLYGYLLYVTYPDQAIAQFRRELEVSPSSSVDRAMLAWALGMQGDFAAALPYAEKSVAENPSLALSQLVLGRDLLETGRVRDGLPHLEAALKAEPRNLEVHLALARAYSELGERDEARRERLLCLTLSDKRTAPDANM